MTPGDPPRPPPRPAADAWLRELAGRLPRHGEVLRRLIEGVRRDPRIVQLSVSCSAGRGTADELSDLDCELSLVPEAWPSGLELIEPLVRSAGDVVELLHHQWAGAGASQHRRTAVVYSNGVQLDLMVWPVTAWSGMHPPDTVVLHATRDVFTHPWDVERAMPTVERLHEWYFLGWWALLDADKYLRRASPWEARQRLEEARTAVCRLAAAAQRLPFPEYGMTALLDAAEPDLPRGLDATASGLDVTAMGRAVQRCAELLEAEWVIAREVVAGRAAPSGIPLGRWALTRLARRETLSNRPSVRGTSVRSTVPPEPPARRVRRR